MKKNELCYIVIKISQLDSVSFNEVYGRKETIRKSLDGSEFIIKWSSNAQLLPESIQLIPEIDRGNILTHSQAYELISSESWEMSTNFIT